MSRARLAYSIHIGVVLFGRISNNAFDVRAQKLDGVRGVGGPLHISPHPDRHPVSDAIIAAAKRIGVPHNDDQNRPDQFALGYMCRTIKDGRRQSAAVAFLNPARGRPNLTIVTDSIVHRVLFENKRAVGIQCGRDPRRRRSVPSPTAWRS